jgi:hypothetical protein
VKIAWHQVRTVGRVWQYLPMHLLQCSCCHSGGVRTRVVLEETGAFDWPTSSFSTKGWWLYSGFKKLRISCVEASLLYQKFKEYDALSLP